MTVKQQLQEDMKTALRAHESQRLEVIRFLLSEIKNSEIDGGGSDDESVLKIIASQVKKSQEAQIEFEKGGRADLVTSEEAKIKIMAAYLPPQLSDEELKEIIAAVKTEVGASVNQGQLIAAVIKRVAGQADGRRISNLVKESL